MLVTDAVPSVGLGSFFNKQWFADKKQSYYSCQLMFYLMETCPIVIHLVRQTLVKGTNTDLVTVKELLTLMSFLSLSNSALHLTMRLFAVLSDGDEDRITMILSHKITDCPVQVMDK